MVLVTAVIYSNTVNVTLSKLDIIGRLNRR